MDLPKQNSSALFSLSRDKTLTRPSPACLSLKRTGKNFHLKETISHALKLMNKFYSTQSTAHFVLSRRGASPAAQAASFSSSSLLLSLSLEKLRTGSLLLNVSNFNGDSYSLRVVRHVLHGLLFEGTREIHGTRDMSLSVLA